MPDCTMSVYLSKQLKARLDAERDRSGVSLAETIRRALDLFLAERETKAREEAAGV